jgi:hypothetical protein
VILERVRLTPNASGKQVNTISDFPKSFIAPQKQSVQPVATQREESIMSVRTGKRLGSYLIEAGLLSFDHLEQALNEQQKTDKRLGEVVSNRGWVNQQTIEYLMEKVVLPERELVLERSLKLSS